jgi:hypothetical protein
VRINPNPWGSFEAFGRSGYCANTPAGMKVKSSGEQTRFPGATKARKECLTIVTGMLSAPCLPGSLPFKLEVRQWKFPDVTFSDFRSAQPVELR